MAWLYVPGLEASSKGLSQYSQNTVPFVMWKGKPIPLPSLLKRWKEGGFIRLLYGLTLSPSKANDGVDRWILSREGSHANRTPKLESCEARMMKGTYGPMSLESLARFDPGSSSWRTSQISITHMERKLLDHWPKSGLMLRGLLYGLPTLAHPIEGRDGSFLPTPTTIPNMLCPSMNHSKAHRNMNRMFATPTVMDSANIKGMRTVAKESLAKGNWRGIDLRTSAILIPNPTVPSREIFPSPTVREIKGGYSQNALIAKDGTNRMRFSLVNYVAKGGIDQNTGKLNPDWLDWLMGWPIGHTALEGPGME